jgi:hypothetical protein
MNLAKPAERLKSKTKTWHLRQRSGVGVQRSVVSGQWSASRGVPAPGGVTSSLRLTKLS